MKVKNLKSKNTKIKLQIMKEIKKKTCINKRSLSYHCQYPRYSVDLAAHIIIQYPFSWRFSW